MESIAGTGKRQYILILKCSGQFVMLFSAKGDTRLEPFFLFAEADMMLWVGGEAEQHMVTVVK